MRSSRRRNLIDELRHAHLINAAGSTLAHLKEKEKQWSNEFGTIQCTIMTRSHLEAELRAGLCESLPGGRRARVALHVKLVLAVKIPVECILGIRGLQHILGTEEQKLFSVPEPGGDLQGATRNTSRTVSKSLSATPRVWWRAIGREVDDARWPIRTIATLVTTSSSSTFGIIALRCTRQEGFCNVCAAQ